jgi:uncharacterized membrane protein HdeD (DUF308 family)
MLNDLRVLIGGFFVLLGVLLITAPCLKAQLNSAPVNLYSGLVMLIFGAVMLLLARRSRR